MYWPDDVKLIVYGDEHFDVPAGVEWRDLRSIDWHQDFKKRHKENNDAHGLTIAKRFRRDCIRFSHKVAALTDVKCDGILIWLDADTFTHARITRFVLDSWLPKDFQMSWLERDKHKRVLSPETGFMMFRDMRDFFDKLIDVYSSDEVFSYAETHDAYVIWQLVIQHNIKTFNLSGQYNVLHNPWASCDLRKYMCHLKGKRKNV
jgi:hypothetical protein